MKISNNAKIGSVDEQELRKLEFKITKQKLADVLYYLENYEDSFYSTSQVYFDCFFSDVKRLLKDTEDIVK
jgi:ribosomal protein S6